MQLLLVQPGPNRVVGDEMVGDDGTPGALPGVRDGQDAGLQREQVRGGPPGVGQGLFKVGVTAWRLDDTPVGCTSRAGTAGAGIVVGA